MNAAVNVNQRIVQLFGLMLLGTLIYLGSDIIMPLGFSFLLSILLLPVYRFFKRIRIPNVLAILLSVLLALVFVASFFVLLGVQLNKLISDFPAIEAHIQQHSNNISRWIESNWGYTVNKQSELINNQLKKVMESAGSLAGGTASSISGILVYLGLIPLYIFLILFYKNLLLRFLFLCSSRDYHEEVEGVIYEMEKTLKSYLIGLVIEMLLVAVMSGLVLFLFGIKYAVLIAVIFAIMNLLPYIGAIIANLLAALITLSTADQLSDVAIVLVVLAVVQFVDNNIVMPYVVGSKVRLNALVTIVAVLIGQALAGVAGMFLAIPTLAVLKLVFDRVQSLKHWGYLLGDEQPKLNPLTSRVLRLRNRLKRKVLDDDPEFNPPTAGKN
jgi:predicted PurR-regulated permease PerM